MTWIFLRLAVLAVWGIWDCKLLLRTIHRELEARIGYNNRKMDDLLKSLADLDTTVTAEIYRRRNPERAKELDGLAG